MGLLFAFPAMAHLALFSFFPLLRSLFLSFHSWNLSGTPEFIGLGNYTRLFSDVDFGRSIGITVFYTVSVTIALFVLALIMALLFDRAFPLRDFFRTIYFIPVVIPWG